MGLASRLLKSVVIDVVSLLFQLSLWNYMQSSQRMDSSSSSIANRSNLSESLALCVKDVNKFYGTGRSAYHALRSLNMEVPYGTM